MKPLRLLSGSVLLLTACSQQPGNAAAIDNATAARDAGATNASTASGADDAASRSEAAAPSAPGPSADTSHATVVGSLKTELVGTGTIDGAAITDVTLDSRCVTGFVTAKGHTAIHWGKVGNFAGDVEGAKAVIPIDDGSGAHRFAMPNGPSFRRVNGAMGLLADDCGGEGG